MSAHRASVTLTPLARQDFHDILLYSVITWGPDQLDRYEERLNRAIHHIRDHPDIGRPCPEVMPGGRRLRTGHHMIYCTATADAVIIHRILHERRHAIPPLMVPEPEE